MSPGNPDLPMRRSSPAAHPDYNPTFAAELFQLDDQAGDDPNTATYLSSIKFASSEERVVARETAFQPEKLFDKMAAESPV